MRKELLIKHISGTANVEQEQQVQAWITKSGANRQYYKNLKNVWVSQTLPQDVATEKQMEQMRLLTYKKDLSGKTTLPGKLERGLYISYSVAAVAVIALILTICIYESGRENLYQNRIELAQIPSEHKHIVYTEKGVKAKLTLPDSSLVWLNSESTIIYPDKFYGTTREIEFKGEAYFKVRKDSLHPMIIKTNKDFTIEVLGTEFNVKSYDNDPTASTTLYSGIINLISESNSGKTKTIQLAPLETCIIAESKMPEVSAIGKKAADNTAAWREGRLNFVSTPMSEVVKVLHRWHGVDITIADPKILNYQITADFYSESMVQIANILKFCALVDYKQDGEKFIFFGR